MPLTSHGGDVVSRAPGKLYIAGEYAVVEPGHRAVLVAVDRFITVRITPCSPSGEYAGTISSRLYANGSRSWRRRPQDGQAEAVAGEDDYIISAIRVVEALVTQGGGRPRSFDLSVSSELEEDDGRKLGLGSSSAVTVATVRAVATFYGMVADDLTVYKLAMLASDTVQPIGSGGDIAASAMTGWVAYTSPDRSWLRRARQRAGAGGMSDLAEADWPGLSVRLLHCGFRWAGPVRPPPPRPWSPTSRPDPTGPMTTPSSCATARTAWLVSSPRSRMMTSPGSCARSRATGLFWPGSAGSAAGPSRPLSCRDWSRSRSTTGPRLRALAPGAGTAESPCAHRPRTWLHCEPRGRLPGYGLWTCRSTARTHPLPAQPTPLRHMLIPRPPPPLRSPHEPRAHHLATGLP